jgi:hypothetical protein
MWNRETIRLHQLPPIVGEILFSIAAIAAFGTSVFAFPNGGRGKILLLWLFLIAGHVINLTLLRRSGPKDGTSYCVLMTFSISMTVILLLPFFYAATQSA